MYLILVSNLADVFSLSRLYYWYHNQQVLFPVRFDFIRGVPESSLRDVPYLLYVKVHFGNGSSLTTVP